MYKILGWINVGIMVVMVTPFMLVHLNQCFLKTKNETYLGIIKFLRPLHRWLAALLIVLALVHGYLALETLQFDSGVWLLVVILVAASLGAAALKLKKKQLFISHEVLATLVFLLLALHLFFAGVFK